MHVSPPIKRAVSATDAPRPLRQYGAGKPKTSKADVKESERLEVEVDAMERRLAELRKDMNNSREQRRNAQEGIWGSARRGTRPVPNGDTSARASSAGNSPPAPVTVTATSSAQGAVKGGAASAGGVRKTVVSSACGSDDIEALVPRVAKNAFNLLEGDFDPSTDQGEWENVSGYIYETTEFHESNFSAIEKFRYNEDEERKAFKAKRLYEKEILNNGMDLHDDFAPIASNEPSFTPKARQSTRY